MAALSHLGLEQIICSLGRFEEIGAIRSPAGATLRSIDNTNVMILRSHLQRALIEAVKEVPVSLGANCIGVESLHSQPVARFDDGSTYQADLVVGADGIRSSVRGSLAPGEDLPRYSGLAACRGVVHAPELVDSAWLSVGRGKQFLATPLPDGCVYWSSLIRYPEGEFAGIEEPRRVLLDLFGQWHEPIPTLLQLPPESAYIPTDVYHRPPPTWLYRGRVALIGDAAHPMTPDLGQGACQAIEDAVVLGACLKDGGDDIDAALADFESRRLSRVRRVVKDARQIGLVQAARSRPATCAPHHCAWYPVPSRIIDSLRSILDRHSRNRSQRSPDVHLLISRPTYGHECSNSPPVGELQMRILRCECWWVTVPSCAGGPTAAVDNRPEGTVGRHQPLRAQS